jgi:hypothetical protein
MPHPAPEKFVGPVEGLGLDILGEADGHGTGLGLVAQHSHSTQKGVGQLFGPGYTVEETGYGAEGVVYRDVSLPRLLELLKDRVRHPSGENVAREQQDREPVNRGKCRPSDHVCGTWPY